MARLSAAMATRSAIMAATGSTLLSPPLRDSLSGIFGSVSLTAWICLLLPQLIQNYRSQSADGLSMAFLFVWLLGDVTNLSGAFFTGLAPTAVAIACYFCMADAVLISQCLYYNALNARRRRSASTRQRRGSSVTAVDEEAEEEAEAQPPGENGQTGQTGQNDTEPDAYVAEHRPLLQRSNTSSSLNVGLPGSHRRHLRRESESNLDPLRRIITGEDETPDSRPWVHNALSLVAVYVVGTAGYFASRQVGAWQEVGGSSTSAVVASSTAVAPIGLVLGYTSAVCYLCARIPQIVKNYREKSCEGLALLFFLLSLTGNFTYGASLVAYSQDRAYLLTALPWLLGSLGTIVEDCIIFVQFRLYAPDRQHSLAAKTAAGSPSASSGAGSRAHDTYGTA